MVKIPEFSKLTDKLDLSGIMNSDLMKNVKAIMSPGSAIPDSAKGDLIGDDLLTVAKELQELKALQTKQADALARLDGIVGNLFHNFVALQNQQRQPEPASTAAGASASVGSKDDDVAK